MGTTVGGEVAASRRIHSSDQVTTVIMTIPTFFTTSHILAVIVIDTIVSNHFFLSLWILSLFNGCSSSYGLFVFATVGILGHPENGLERTWGFSGM